jgi:vacuolar-type H+-ATPase subunit H
LTTMVTSITRAEGVLAPNFKKVKNGLDEAEVFSFVGGLIDQNNALATKLENLDLLKKLAESNVIQAEQLAETIKKEAEKAATFKAASIITSAEEQAKSEADRLIAESRQRADESANTMLTSAQRQAKEIVKAAETQAQQQAAEIMRGAEAEAQRRAEEIVKAAEVRAQQQAQEMLSRSREVLERTIVEKYRKFVVNLIPGIEEIEKPHPY